MPIGFTKAVFPGEKQSIAGYRAASENFWKRPKETKNDGPGRLPLPTALEVFCKDMRDHPINIQTIPDIRR